jgi:hypothetical protein
MTSSRLECWGSDGNALDFIERDLVTGTIVQLRPAGQLVRSYGLRVLDAAALLMVAKRPRVNGACGKWLCCA